MSENIIAAGEVMETMQGAVEAVPAVEAVAVKPYTLRKLCSRDVFLFSRILSKIGIKQFQDCFEVEEQDGEEKLALSMTGLNVALNVIDILLANLDKCEQDVYTFLANVAGMTAEEVADLDMGVFAEMVIEVFQKKEFADFFKAVSRLLDLGK